MFLEPRPIAGPGPDRDIRVSRLQVDDLVAGGKADRELRMLHLECAQPPGKPGVSERVRRRDRQEALVLLPMAGEGRLDGVERAAQRRQQPLPQGRQPGPSSLTDEQRRAEPLLKRLHLVGDRGLCQPKLRRRGREAFMPGRGFERPDGGEWRKAAHQFSIRPIYDRCRAFDWHRNDRIRR